MNFAKTLCLTILTIFVFFPSKTLADTFEGNDLYALLLSNRANIYAVNIRTFNAKDTNNNGIIDENEESGNFLNAIERLDELTGAGINVINLLPVTSVGKVKALGTAGSIFAASSFNDLNPQLKNPNSNLSLKDEMKKFVFECHKRNIQVIVDMPCCGAYDLYLKRPELFKKDKNQNPITPSDWTDVRLLDAGSESNINMDVYNLYSEFIELMLDIGVDGIRANSAYIKPYYFWKKLIGTTKARSPQFVFIAEASSQDKPISEHASFTTYNKLLEAGFDGCSIGCSNFKNFQNSKDLYTIITTNLKLENKYPSQKFFISDLNTHNEISPILVNGTNFSKMILWLSTTLPMNAYYLDGFQTGDDYIYYWANKKASKTYTDDDYYFTHRGQLDLFNFSRKPQGKNYDLLNEFVLAKRFKKIFKDTLSKGNFVPLNTSCSSVFAYARSYNSQTIIIIGNLNYKKPQNAFVSVPKLTKDINSVPIKLKSIPKINKGGIQTELLPGEIMILLFNDLNVK